MYKYQLFLFYYFYLFLLLAWSWFLFACLFPSFTDFFMLGQIYKVGTGF